MGIKKSIFTEDYQEIIARLKTARIEEKLTQKQVAKALGVGQSFISKIESGQYRIDVIQIKMFAKLYKKPISYFYK